MTRNLLDTFIRAIEAYWKGKGTLALKERMNCYELLINRQIKSVRDAILAKRDAIFNSLRWKMTGPFRAIWRLSRTRVKSDVLMSNRLYSL